MEEGNSETSFENQEIAKLLKSISSKMSFRENNFIRNNTTRSLIIFGINKIEVSYRLTSNILALLSEILDDKQ